MSIRTEARYEVVQSCSVGELTKAVNDLLKVGFQCVGGPFIHENLVCQAVLFERFEH